MNLLHNKRLIILSILFLLFIFIFYGSFKYGWIDNPENTNKVFAQQNQDMQNCFIVRNVYTDSPVGSMNFYICADGIYYSIDYVNFHFGLKPTLYDTHIFKLSCNMIMDQEKASNPLFIFYGSGIWASIWDSLRQPFTSSQAGGIRGFKIQNESGQALALFYNSEDPKILAFQKAQAFYEEPTNVKGSFVVKTNILDEDGSMVTKTLFFVDAGGVNYRFGMCGEKKLLSGVQSISAGSNSVCAIMLGGTLKCWGGGPEFATTTTNLSNVTKISIGTPEHGGGTQYCALLTDGTVKCWGDNSYKQSVCSNNDYIATPTDVGLTNATDISAGMSFSWASIRSQILKRWGHVDTYNQLPAETFCSGSSPQTVPSSGNSISELSSSKSSAFGCFIVNNVVKCWAKWDTYYNFGILGGVSPTTTPVTINVGAGTVLKVAVGGAHACVLMENGTKIVKCWGNNASGQLGNASGGFSATPIVVSGLYDAGFAPIDISAGDAHTCVRLENGAVKCWGDNTTGQLGGNASQQGAPVLVSDVTNATSISLGSYFTCALLSDTTVKCWGSNKYNQLGAGNAYIPGVFDACEYATFCPSTKIPHRVRVDEEAKVNLKN